MDFLAELVFTGIFAITGRVVVRLGTLGCWACDPLFGNAHRTRSAAGALSYVHDGRRVVTADGQILAGFVFYAALVVLLIVSVSA